MKINGVTAVKGDRFRTDSSMKPRNDVPPCPYQGQPIEGDTLTLSIVCGCKKSRTRETKVFVVHDCALHGRCVPGYSCAKTAITEEIKSGEWATSCHTCPDNPRNASR